MTKKATREWNVQILVTRHEDNLCELAMHKLAYTIKIALKETYFEGLDWILPVQSGGTHLQEHFIDTHSSYTNSVHIHICVSFHPF